MSCCKKPVNVRYVVVSYKLGWYRVDTLLAKLQGAFLMPLVWQLTYSWGFYEALSTFFQEGGSVAEVAR